MENQNPEEEIKVKQMIDELVEKAKIASKEYLKLDQETVDNVIKAMSMAGLAHHMELAKMAVEETKRGIYEDKITKNMFATEYVYHSIKYEKTVGIIRENEEDDYVEIAEPVGIIAGVTPVTNPTSTTMFKSIISAKTRNVIIFGFHPSAQKCSVEAARILRDAAIKAGAPENCSERERTATKVEREAIDIKKADFMEDKIGQEYDGIVSSVTNFGIFVELENTVEGLIRYENLGDEYFIFNEERREAIGEHTHKTYKIGDKIKIRVVDANKLLRRIDFEIIGE